MFKKIDRCRVCQNTHLVDVLDLGEQALTGVFPKTKSQRVTTGPLRLVKCTGGEEICGLLQLQHTYEPGELYGDNYGYRSGLNPSMVSHLHGKVRNILERIDVPNRALIIDVGANDSTTLQAYPANTYTLVGIDPTGAKFRSFYPSHVQLIPEFFSASAVKRHFGSLKASVITSFSMLYDLEEPMNFMRDVSDVLADDGLWVLEQSYLPTMLRKNAYDTVCHEHLEYYALRQIKWMADRSELKIVDVEFNDVNGGSFSVVVAKQSSHHNESPRVAQTLASERGEALDSSEPYECFARRVADSKTTLRQFLDNAHQSGMSVSALGASTKGNVLLQYCGITETDITKIGEVNPDKFGSFTPGTLLPIVSEDEVLSERPDYLIVLPWHFRKFFEKNPDCGDRTLVFPLPELEVLRRTMI